MAFIQMVGLIFAHALLDPRLKWWAQGDGLHAPY